MSRQETRWAWLFLAPWVIGFLVFTGGPMIASLVLSFTEYDVISSPKLVGLENYRQLMADPAVAKSLGNTVFYTALHVPWPWPSPSAWPCSCCAWGGPRGCSGPCSTWRS